MTQEEFNYRFYLIELEKINLNEKYEQLKADAIEAILSHEKRIIELAQTLFFHRDNTCPAVEIEFNNVNPGGYTVLEDSRTLINLNLNVWKTLQPSISLLAHEYFHALRPNPQVAIANYLEEGMARWFENQYMKYAGFPQVDYSSIPGNEKYESAEKLYILARPHIHENHTKAFNSNLKIKVSEVNVAMLQSFGLNDVFLCQQLATQFIY
ncbi:hypothetical protein D3C72_1085320 [compost metagenome]